MKMFLDDKIVKTIQDIDEFYKNKNYQKGLLICIKNIINDIPSKYYLSEKQFKIFEEKWNFYQNEYIELENPKLDLKLNNTADIEMETETYKTKKNKDSNKDSNKDLSKDIIKNNKKNG